MQLPPTKACGKRAGLCVIEVGSSLFIFITLDGTKVFICPPSTSQTLAVIALGQMIEVTERQISDLEKKILLDRIPSQEKRAESAVMGFIVVLGIFLAPLLLIDKYWFDVPSNVQSISLIPIVAIAAYLAYRLDKMGFDSKYITSDIEAGVVTVYNVKTNRVVKRKDPEDFGPSYYIDL